MKKLITTLLLLLCYIVAFSQITTGGSNFTPAHDFESKNKYVYTITDVGAEWVGFWDSTSDYAQILVILEGKNDSLGGDLTMEFAVDTSSAIIVLERSVPDLEEILNQHLLNAAPYFRVKFTPSRALIGSEAVIINTQYSRFYSGDFVIPTTNNPYATGISAAYNLSILKGARPDGRVYDLAIDPSGALVNGDANLQIAAGNLDIYTKFTIAGRNPDLDSGIKRLLWAGDAVYTGQPTGASTQAVAETITILSSSIADAAVGTGARTIEVIGLDENGMEQKDTLTLNGAVGVTSTTLWYRVFIVKVLTAGITGSNEGVLTTRQTVTVANVFSAIPIGQNKSSIAVYTVPSDKKAYIEDIYANAGGSGTTGELRLLGEIREFGGVWIPEIDYDLTQTGAFDPNISFGITLMPLTDIKYSGTSTVNNIIGAIRSNIIIEEITEN